MRFILGQTERGGRAAVGLVAAIFCFWFTFCPAATAQLKDCKGSHPSGSYKVYLDELSFAPGTFSSDSDRRFVMQELEHHLSTKFEELSTGTDPVHLEVLYCEERKPGSKSVFNEDRVGELDNDRVVLELWGTVSGDDIWINHLMIPIWLDLNGNAIHIGIQEVKRPLAESGEAGRFIDLLKDWPELKAFLAGVIGIDLLKNEEYDQAKKFLCKAYQELQNLEDVAGSSGTLITNKVALAEYIENALRRVADEASQDTTYHGALGSLVSPSDCSDPDGGN